MNTINGRTPEEIKRGAHVCTSDVDPCTLCPYLIDLHAPIKCRQKQLMEDMYILIRQLERERDAAVEGLTIIANNTGSCIMCKHRVHPGYVCDRFEREENCYEWRGVQEVE